MIFDPKAVMENVHRAYSSFEKYSCRASLTRMIQTDRTTYTHLEMRLSYSKPKKLFVEWWHKNRPDNRKIIISSGKCAVRCRPNDAEFEAEESVEMALAGDAGISSGLALYIPSLLIGNSDYTMFERFESCSNVSIGPDDLCNVKGFGVNSNYTSIIVRRADNVIVGMNEIYPIPNGKVECKSEYFDIQSS